MNTRAGFGGGGDGKGVGVGGGGAQPLGPAMGVGGLGGVFSAAPWPERGGSAAFGSARLRSARLDPASARLADASAPLADASGALGSARARGGRGFAEEGAWPRLLSTRLGSAPLRLCSVPLRLRFGSARLRPRTWWAGLRGRGGRGLKRKAACSGEGGVASGKRGRGHGEERAWPPEKGAWLQGAWSPRGGGGEGG